MPAGPPNAPPSVGHRTSAMRRWPKSSGRCVNAVSPRTASWPARITVSRSGRARPSPRGAGGQQRATTAAPSAPRRLWRRRRRHEQPLDDGLCVGQRSCGRGRPHDVRDRRLDPEHVKTPELPARCVPRRTGRLGRGPACDVSRNCASCQRWRWTDAASSSSRRHRVRRRGRGESSIGVDGTRCSGADAHTQGTRVSRRDTAEDDVALFVRCDLYHDALPVEAATPCPRESRRS